MLIIEFADNNNVSTFINVLFFYANKEFHSRMNFSSNIIDYVITRKRFNIIKTKKIIDDMQDILIFIRDRFDKAQLIMIE